MQTPAQSMLPRPPASAAVIACAARATRDNICSTVSLGNRPGIFPTRASFALVPLSTNSIHSETANVPGTGFGGQAVSRNPEKMTMPKQNPDPPYEPRRLDDPPRDPFVNELRTPVDLDNEIQPD